MSRLFVVLIAAMWMPAHPFAEPAIWTCKPIWTFSGMGSKSYEGSSANKAAARDSARGNCVKDNRGLELDDFCLSDPKGNDWHCSQIPEQTTGALPN